MSSEHYSLGPFLWQYYIMICLKELEIIEIATYICMSFIND